MDLLAFSLSIFPWALEGDFNIHVREQDYSFYARLAEEVGKVHHSDHLAEEVRAAPAPAT